MRKIISLLLCVVLTAGCWSAVYGLGEAQDSLGTDRLAALDLLSAFGIANDMDEDTFDADKKITRGEFAVYAAALVNAEKKGGDIYFYDVPESHYAFSAVSALVQKSAVSVGGDRLFNPEEVISFTDAGTILVRLLGYETYAQVKGGYPAEYIDSIRILKLGKGCRQSAELLASDMIMLLKNALVAGVMDINTVNSNGVAEYKESGKTLLEIYFDSFYAKGTVTALKGMGLYGSADLGFDEIEIDEKHFRTTKTADSDLFGKKVEYVYTESDSGENYVVWIFDTKDREELFVESDGENCTFDSAAMQLKYYEEDSNKQKTAKISNSVTVIYNGENYSGSLESLLTDGSVYNITLISSESGADYDVAVIEKYVTSRVESVDPAIQTIYSSDIKYELESFERTELFNGSGAKITLSDIGEKDIISAAVSLSGDTFKAYVSSDSLSGVVEKTFADGAKLKVVISGNTYVCTNSALFALLNAGNSVSIDLDAFGKIFDVKIGSANGFLAYLMGIARANDMDKTLKFKLLTEKGEVEVFDLDTKVVIDDTMYSDKDLIESLFRKNGGLEGQLMLCSATGDENETQKIKKIDTKASGGFQLDISRDESKIWSDGATYKSGTGNIGPKVMINADTKIFCVSSTLDDLDENDFMVKTKSQLSHDAVYLVDSFKMEGQTSEYAYAVVINDAKWGNASNSTKRTLVEGISSAMDEEGNIYNMIEGWQGSTAVQLRCDDDFDISSIKPGDILSVNKNSKGYVKSSTLVYRDGVTSLSGGGTFNDPLRLLFKGKRTKRFCFKGRLHLGCSLRRGYAAWFGGCFGL